MNTKVSKYNFFFEDEGKYYVFNSLSNALFEFNQDLYSRLINAKENQNSIDKSSYEEFDELYNYSIITSDKDEKREINKIKLGSYLERFNKQLMSLTIAPTSYCNFNCPYCYEKSRPKIFMSDDTAAKLLEFVTDQKQLTNLHVMWYGGEPLLNFKMIRTLTRQFQGLGLNYSAGIVTNGYLLNQFVANKLEELNITIVQITIDGPREVHDSRRFHVRTKKSFDKIISNIDYLLSVNSHVALNIRVNIDKSNEDSFPQLMQFLQEKYASFKNVLISPSYVQEVSGVNKCNLDRMSKAMFKLKYKDLNVFDFYPSKLLSGCMATHINSYVINADGGMFKCYNDIGIKEKQIANLHEKSINTELLTSYLVEADYLSDATCMDCKLMPVCSGGCPYDRIYKGTIDPQGTCLVMKDFEKEFLVTHIKQKAL